MAVTSFQITIPSGATPVTVIQSTPNNSNSVSIRNTGTVTVLLGSTGAVLFPLVANEFLGLELAVDDTLVAQVQTAGTAGQLTILGVG